MGFTFFQTYNPSETQNKSKASALYVEGQMKYLYWHARH